MLKVLLVDDEPTVLQGLKIVLPWEEMGFVVSGEASNGEEAVRHIEECPPDLVVTDVRMPKMDGIALANWIRQYDSEIAVIIVSGYDEFDYAQSAMQVGVSEYLLKPLKQKQWEETILRVQQQILKKRQQREAIANMEKELQYYRPIMKNQYLSELAQGNIYEEDPFLRLQTLGTALQNAPYYLICFDADWSQKRDGQRESNDLMHLYQRNVVALRLSRFGVVESFHAEGRWYYLLEDPVGLPDFEEMLESACREAIEEFGQVSGISISAGVSLRYESLAELSMAKGDCELALEARLMGGGENCILTSQVGALCGGGIPFHMVNLDGVMNNLRLLEEEKANKMLAIQFRQLKKEGALPNQFYGFASTVLLELYNLTTSNGAPKTLGMEIWGRLSCLPQYKTAADLLDFCQGTISYVLSELKKQTREKNKEIADEITRYITAHLAEELTLQMVADHIHVSRNYLCSIFRREFHDTFVTYLTRLRISKAKELLKNSKMKTYEIAALVGYNDYVYFAQVFKKQVGVTTTEYRKNAI